MLMMSMLVRGPEKTDGVSQLSSEAGTMEQTPPCSLVVLFRPLDGLEDAHPHGGGGSTSQNPQDCTLTHWKTSNTHTFPEIPSHLDTTWASQVD